MKSPNVNIETVTLQMAHVVVQQAIDERALILARNQIEVSSHMNHHLRHLVVMLQAHLAAGDRQQVMEETVCYLADWRQWFKARWFKGRVGRWLLRKYPLQHKVVKVPTKCITRVCPHLAIPVGGNRTVTYLKPHFDHCLAKDPAE